MHPQVDEFLSSVKRWQKELRKLRTVVLDSGLTEDWKWRSPCYVWEGSNIAILAELKDCCTLGFFKGALLKDAQGVLGKPGKNTRAARTIRFTSVQEIVDLEPIVRAYLKEAIEVERAGLKVDFTQGREVDIPEELQAMFDTTPGFEEAFDALTPGRRRAYLLHFSAAKQSRTRTSRISKYVPRILDGKGMNDCVCGHSQKLPACNGSHKNFE